MSAAPARRSSHWTPHAGWSLVALAVVILAGCTSEAPARPGVITVSKEQQASWLRNFNPFSAGASRWPTEAGVHEPLMIFNSVRGVWVPWLATGYRWQGNTVLHFDLREGVEWSDGQAFSSADVAFTFGLMKRHRALDQGGVWGYLADVRAEGPDQVRFEFARPYTPGMATIAHVPIVPRHIWRQVADPVRFDNPDPVGTGPFTEVLRFENQVFELGRNPHYWQRGKPGVKALRMPAYPSNDQANMALVNGEVDWAGNFVPAVQRTFVQRDAANHGYWFPLVGGTVFLYLNTTKRPFDDVRVRKALSMGLDRARIVRVAMYDYTVEADATGLSHALDSWRDPSAVTRGQAWMAHDPERANRILDAAGYVRNADGLRTLPGTGGETWSFELIVVAGWSDWVRAAQIITRSFEKLGIDTRVRVFDFSPWFEKMQQGNFDMAIAWSSEGPTPYAFYRWLMSDKTVKPIGQAAAGNWHRYGSRRAARLLDDFESTTDHGVQRRIASELQQVFVDEAPAIPLFPNPSWGVYSTRRATGFPTRDHPFAALSPNKIPEALLVMTNLSPRDEAAGRASAGPESR